MVTVTADESGSVLRTGLACALEFVLAAVALPGLVLYYDWFLDSAGLRGAADASAVRVSAAAVSVVWVVSVPVVGALLANLLKLSDSRPVVIGFAVLLTVIGWMFLFGLMAFAADCNGVSLLPNRPTSACR